MPEHKEKEEHHPEHKEGKPEHHKQEGVTVKKSTIMLVSFTIIALVIGIAAGYLVGSMGKSPGIAASGDKNEIANKVIAYLNANIVQAGTNATLSEVSEENGLIKITTLYQGSEIPIYTTQDGTLLFLSSPVMTNATISEAQQQPSSSITPKEKASAELFVMSFCPYGVQAEQIMKPVADLLGSKADIKVRFIVSISGDTPDTVQSLHGALEAQEDLRQVCIMKHYPDKFWDYVEAINRDCYPNYRTSGALDVCWKAAATNLSIEIAKIETCANGTEGMDLLKVDEAIANAYGVSGSPTLIINGAQYSGARSVEGYKAGICSGFTTPPTECAGVVNASASNTPAVQGNC